MTTFCIIESGKESDGRATYTVRSDKGTDYAVHMAHKGLPIEVATLAKLANGGRAWRWAKDVTKGIAADVVAHVQASIARNTSPETVAAVRKVKPENWQTLAQTLQCTLGAWLSSDQLRQVRHGVPNAETIARIVDSAQKVINTTHNSMERAACSAIVDTMKAYGLMSPRLALSLMSVHTVLPSARTQYRAAFRDMAMGGEWGFYVGSVGIVLARAGEIDSRHMVIANVQAYSEQNAINALHAALQRAAQ